MTEFLLERKKHGQINGLIKDLWLIFCYTVQLVIRDVCTKYLTSIEHNRVSYIDMLIV